MLTPREGQVLRQSMRSVLLGCLVASALLVMASHAAGRVPPTPNAIGPCGGLALPNGGCIHSLYYQVDAHGDDKWRGEVFNPAPDAITHDLHDTWEAKSKAATTITASATPACRQHPLSCAHIYSISANVTGTLGLATERDVWRPLGSGCQPAVYTFRETVPTTINGNVGGYAGTQGVGVTLSQKEQGKGTATNWGYTCDDGSGHATTTHDIATDDHRFPLNCPPSLGPENDVSGTVEFGHSFTLSGTCTATKSSVNAQGGPAQRQTWTLTWTATFIPCPHSGVDVTHCQRK